MMEKSVNKTVTLVNMHWRSNGIYDDMYEVFYVPFLVVFPFNIIAILVFVKLY